MDNTYLGIPVPTPTQDPVPSADIRDHVFAGAKLDEFVNSLINQYIDRFGHSRLTIAGITNLAQAVIEKIKTDGENAVSSVGWQEIGDWSINVLISNRDQVVWYNNAWYKYIGEIPHTINAESPEGDGGIWSKENPDGKWVNIGDAALRTLLAGESGASHIGVGKTTLDKLISVDVEQFGAVPYTSPGFEDFDSAPAFREAIAYAKENGIGTIVAKGKYKLLSAGQTTYELPRDDGTCAPQFIAKGDVNIPAEIAISMPVVLDVPSWMVIVGDVNAKAVAYLDFGWNKSSSPISTSQHIGIVWRVTGWPNNNRMNQMVRGVGLRFINIANAFIGALSDGVMFYQNMFDNISFNSCGIPILLQGSDAVQFRGSTEITNCLSGIVIGGMWLTRNNTTNAPYLPPYPATDIYALGWCDYTVFELIGCSYDQTPFGQRHRDIDQFFATYFYKVQNTAEYPAGRLSINYQRNNNNSMPIEKYRGISHRAFTNFSRYGRGNCNVEIKDAKLYGVARVPFYTPTEVGADYYGVINNCYSERTGVADPSAAWSASNDHYSKSDDPWNSDYSTLPYTVAEGTLGAREVTLQSTALRPSSQKERYYNDNERRVIWTADAEAEKGKIRRQLATYDSKGVWREYENFTAERILLEPGIMFTGANASLDRAFKYRVETYQLSIYDDSGNTNIPVQTSVIWVGGRAICYFKFNVPADAASRRNEMSIRYVPKRGNFAFGSANKAVTSIEASFVTYIERPVYNSGGTLIGSARIPKRLEGAKSGDDQILRLYANQELDSQISLSDLKPNSVFEFMMVYNSPWSIY
ncbi:hypothetical protein SM12BL3_14610 [Serratia marcescens]|nr:hypothetical protein SM12BL3_14610 [Serratia marcescens]